MIYDARSNQKSSTEIITALRSAIASAYPDSLKVVENESDLVNSPRYLRLKIIVSGTDFKATLFNKDSVKTVINRDSVQRIINQNYAAAPEIYKPVVAETSVQDIEDKAAFSFSQDWIATNLLNLVIVDNSNGDGSISFEIPIATQKGGANWWGTATGEKLAHESWDLAGKILFRVLTRFVAQANTASVQHKTKTQIAGTLTTPDAPKISVQPKTAALDHTKPDSFGQIVTGTGWVVTKGYVVSNYHVVERATKIVLIAQNGARIRGQIASADQTNDLALIKVDDVSLLPAALPIDESPVSIGTSVFTLGFPHPDMMGLDAKLTDGRISSTTGLAGDPRMYQISVPLQSGNSGGPLIDMHGRVVGIVSNKLSALALLKAKGELPENVNYAIKVGYLRQLLSDLPTLSSPVVLEVKPGADLSDFATKYGGSVLLIVVERSF